MYDDDDVGVARTNFIVIDVIDGFVERTTLSYLENYRTSNRYKIESCSKALTSTLWKCTGLGVASS